MSFVIAFYFVVVSNFSLFHCVIENLSLSTSNSKPVLKKISFFLMQVIPMLPRLLCEELCSLNSMTDRLTFSVIWKLSPEGKVLCFIYLL